MASDEFVAKVDAELAVLRARDRELTTELDELHQARRAFRLARADLETAIRVAESLAPANGDEVHVEKWIGRQ